MAPTHNPILAKMLQYLEGKMTLEESAAFEEKLKEEELFALAFEELKHGFETQSSPIDKITQHGPAFREGIHQMTRNDSPGQGPIPRKKRPRWIRYTLVALIALLIGLSWWQFWYTTADICRSEIAQIYLQAYPYQESLTTLSARPTAPDQVQKQKQQLLDQFLVNYQSGTEEAYRQALTLSKALQSQAAGLSFREQIEIQLCQAYILLYLGEGKSALQRLDDLAKQGETHFAEEILWLQTMTHLSLKNWERADQNLAQLLNSEGSETRQRAQDLQNLLKETVPCE